jgi:hypothetical protein
MTPRLHLALVAWIALVFGFGLGSARAAEDASPIAAPSSIEAEPEAQAEEPANPPPGPIPPHPVGPVPVLPPVEEAEASPPSSLERWPIEYVLRPQTLPEGMVELGVSSRVVRPQSGPLTTAAGAPYTFNPYFALGAWLRLGVTERFDLEFSAPRILCLEEAALSGCNDINRYNGTGVSATYGVLRSRTLQLKLFGNVSVARSAKPLTWAWELGARTKILFGQSVALEMGIDFNRRIDPGSSQTDTSAHGSFVVELNVQATHHLNVFADLNPYAPVDRLGEPALEPFGGVSWTFNNQSEIVASAGAYNVLSRRSWDNNVPETFYVLSLVFWF